jgi:hypothetical protein
MSNAIQSIDRGLALALESPDPVVRNLAIRREEIHRDLARLDNFLGAYAELSSGARVPTLSGTDADSSEAKPTPGATSRRNRPDFGEEVVGIILAHGAPMPFESIRAAYADRHGAEPEQNIRKRLRRREDVLRVIDGRGFWPVGRPIPGGSNGAADIH